MKIRVTTNTKNLLGEPKPLEWKSAILPRKENDEKAVFGDFLNTAVHTKYSIN